MVCLKFGCSISNFSIKIRSLVEYRLLLKLGCVVCFVNSYVIIIIKVGFINFEVCNVKLFSVI